MHMEVRTVQELEVGRQSAILVGELVRWLSPWWSHVLACEKWPWVCEKGGKPALVISMLEALAVLFSMKFFFGLTLRRRTYQGTSRPDVDAQPRGTVPLGTSFLSTIPSSAVIMELSCLKRASAKAIVEWAPRTTSYGAEVTLRGSTPRRRIPLNVDGVHWDVLPSALVIGRKMEADTLQTRDPW